MDAIDRYLQLADQRPELFRPSEQIPLCLDEEILRGYTASTGRPVGVVYDNLPYYLVLADLCVRESGELYTYARVIYPHSQSNGVWSSPAARDAWACCPSSATRPAWRAAGSFPGAMART